MRVLFSLARLLVVLTAFVPPVVRSQNYYTRIVGNPDEGDQKPPIIENVGLSSSTDIHVFPSPNHQSETSIAVNWCNSVNMLIGANVVGGFSYTQGYYYSESCGLLWDGNDAIPPGDVFTSDPAIAYDANNIGNPNGYSNAFFNYLSWNGISFQVKVQKSTNGGSTWSAGVQIPSVGDPDKNHMIADPTGSSYSNNLYVAYTDFTFFPGSPIKASRSTNGGASFTTPLNISMGVTSHFSQGVNLSVGPAGEVYAVWAVYDDWNDNDPNTWDEEAIGFAKSTNGGLTWETPSRIREIEGIRGWWTHKNPTGEPIRVNSFPSMAIDRSGGPFHGHMYLVWANKGTGVDKADIHLSKSTNGGATWSVPARVNNDNTTYDQWMPWISVSPLGRITVAFLDSRNDNTHPVNQATETWIAQSTDGGNSFENLRVSDVSFIPSPIPNTATGYMGDYIGVTTKPGSAYTCWTDNRSGPFQIYLDIHESYLADLENVATWNRSPFALATANGSGPKLVYAGGKWHRVFQVNEHIAYSSSTNDGITWTGHDLINGSATGWLSNPSLHYSGNKLHVVFRTDNSQVYYVRGTTGAVWEEPRVLVTAGGAVTGISSSVDANGICHVVYTTAGSGPSGNSYVVYGTFNTSDPNPVLGGIVNLASSYGALTSPGITVDANNLPHAVWTGAGDVFYRFKSGSTWSSSSNISNTTTTSSLPTISYGNNSIHAAWQENLTGNREIYYKSKIVGGTWGTVQNLSNNSTPSVEPSLIGSVGGEPLVVWADSIGSNYDTRYKQPVSGASGSFTATSLQSHHPVFGARAITNGARVVLMCTDGSSSLYQIVTDKRDFTSSSKAVADEKGTTNESQGRVILYQNYPNPFNPATVLTFELPREGQVELKVFDLIGRELSTLVDGVLGEGRHSVELDASSFSSGIYLYRLQHPEGVLVRRMIVVK
jgi:hypothetical protein